MKSDEMKKKRLWQTQQTRQKKRNATIFFDYGAPCSWNSGRLFFCSQLLCAHRYCWRYKPQSHHWIPSALRFHFLEISWDLIPIWMHLIGNSSIRMRACVCVSNVTPVCIAFHRISVAFECSNSNWDKVSMEKCHYRLQYHFRRFEFWFVKIRVVLFMDMGFFRALLAVLLKIKHS